MCWGENIFVFVERGCDIVKDNLVYEEKFSKGKEKCYIVKKFVYV